MTGKELLELAAKAAGLAVVRVGEVFYFQHNDYLMAPWNPLTDDGEALRLAVKLGLAVVPYFYYDERRQSPAHATKSGGGMIKDTVGTFPAYKESFTKHDPYAATRRAIVRAAAEIGRSMK